MRVWAHGKLLSYEHQENLLSTTGGEAGHRKIIRDGAKLLEGEITITQEEWLGEQPEKANINSLERLASQDRFRQK